MHADRETNKRGLTSKRILKRKNYYLDEKQIRRLWAILGTPVIT